MFKKTTIVLVMTFGLFIVFSFTSTDPEPWSVPSKYEKMKNPVDADKASLKIGKSLYGKHCKSCHGKEGLGDGSKAAQLDTPCGDFSSKAFQAQSDGVLFYKTKFGRDDMPSFEKKIRDDEDFWHLVNWMRTFE